jgi:hypothetical protein
MSEALTRLIKQTAVSVDRCTVTIELTCSDAYGAHVLFDDVVGRITSKTGFVLKLRGEIDAGDGADQ